MLKDGRMCHHFRVRVLVALGDLDDAVERQYPPEGGVLEQLNVLEVRPFIGQHPGDREGLRVPSVQDFGEFARHCPAVRRRQKPGRPVGVAPIY